jgi:hypothetical protein
VAEAMPSGLWKKTMGNPAGGGPRILGLPCGRGRPAMQQQGRLHRLDWPVVAVEGDSYVPPLRLHLPVLPGPPAPWRRTEVSGVEDAPLEDEDVRPPRPGAGGRSSQPSRRRHGGAVAIYSEDEGRTTSREGEGHGRQQQQQQAGRFRTTRRCRVTMMGMEGRWEGQLGSVTPMAALGLPLRAATSTSCTTRLSGTTSVQPEEEQEALPSQVGRIRD